MLLFGAKLQKKYQPANITFSDIPYSPEYLQDKPGVKSIQNRHIYRDIHFFRP